MMTRFSVKNYKCLADVSLPLTPIHVLIGPNDSGKTSLLEAMYAFFQGLTEDLQSSFPGYWYGRELVFEKSAQPQVELVAEQDFGSHQEDSRFLCGIRVGFSQDTKKRKCTLLKEWWEHGAHHFTRETGRRHIQLPGDEERERDLRLRRANLLGSTQMYRLDAKVMALPAAIQLDRKFRLAPDGFGIPTLLDDLLGDEPESYLSIRKKFCELFPEFKKFRVESETAIVREYSDFAIKSSEATTGKALYFETQQGMKIRSQQVSEGAILFLGILTLCHVPNPPKYLLIEEPERGIYPKKLDEMVGLLKGLREQRLERPVPQIVLSTHSPYLASFFEPEEVTYMSRQPDGTVRARPLRDAPQIHERMSEGFYLGELWYNLSEEELFGDAQPAANA